MMVQPPGVGFGGMDDVLLLQQPRATRPPPPAAGAGAGPTNSFVGSGGNGAALVVGVY
jgi:hypothetical protein